MLTVRAGKEEELQGAGERRRAAEGTPWPGAP